MKKILRTLLITLVLISMVFISTGCSKTYKETQVVDATVTKMEYIESQTKYGYYYDVWKSKFRWKFKTFPAEYNVTIQYQDIEKTYNNKALFESIELNGTISVDYTVVYDEENQILSRDISLH